MGGVVVEVPAAATHVGCIDQIARRAVAVVDVAAHRVGDAADMGAVPRHGQDPTCRVGDAAESATRLVAVGGRVAVAVRHTGDVAARVELVDAAPLPAGVKGERAVAVAEEVAGDAGWRRCSCRCPSA